MWPMLLDMTKEESVQSLRCLELEAYAGLVTALRAQGSLNQDKLNALKEICTILNISQERHKAEIRRVVNDEKLTTIAYHASGQKLTNDEWLQEGRRLIPLMPRIAPQTAYSAIADEVADSTSKTNKQLPLPSNTERKRQSPILPQTSSTESQNKLLFRVPDFPKTEECKKRKFSMGVENSSLAQHLMCPPKVSRIQQIYRQKNKPKQKEFQLKLKQTELERQELQLNQQQVVSSQKINKPTSPINKTPKLIIQSTATSLSEDDVTEQTSQSSTDEESGVSKTFPVSNRLQPITFKHVPNTNAGTSGEMHKTIKVCTSRKPAITKTMTTSTGQKLIVVSNPQSITTSSILQRTLTIPFVKNLSVKNIDKFKIVTTNSTTPVQLAPINSTSTFSANTKHKVVTVRTNPIKKVIPISQLQVLNAKGGIKVLPIGGKIVTKTNGNSGSPIYIVNSSTNMQALTKSTSSTPSVVMSPMAQECSLSLKKETEEKENNDNLDVVETVKKHFEDKEIEQYNMEEIKAETNEDDKKIKPEIIYDKSNEEERMDVDEAELSDSETTLYNTDDIQRYKITDLGDIQSENFLSNCESSSSDDKLDSDLETLTTNETIDDNLTTTDSFKEDVYDSLSIEKHFDET